MQRDDFRFDEIEVIEVQPRERRLDQQAEAMSKENDRSTDQSLQAKQAPQPTTDESLKIESLGQRLRAARELLKVSEVDVADYLRISPKTIRMIEEDNYAAFDNVTFLRGYIRAYAKWLKFPQEEISQAFLQLGLKETFSVDTAVKFDLSQVSSRDKPVRLVTYSILILLVLLVSIWGYIHYQSDKIVNQFTASISMKPSVNQLPMIASVPTEPVVAPVSAYANSRAVSSVGVSRE